ALVFGNSVWAATIVLASFMGGLALGGALAGRYARGPHRRLLRVYAALEAIVGVTGLALTYLLPPLAATIARLSAGSSGVAVNAIRLAASFLVMIVPTTAMGATLPVLVSALVRTRERFAPTVGRLYGWNTLG